MYFTCFDRREWSRLRQMFLLELPRRDLHVLSFFFLIKCLVAERVGFRRRHEWQMKISNLMLALRRFITRHVRYYVGYRARWNVLYENWKGGECDCIGIQTQEARPSELIGAVPWRNNKTFHLLGETDFFVSVRTHSYSGVLTEVTRVFWLSKFPFDLNVSLWNWHSPVPVCDQIAWITIFFSNPFVAV